MQLSQPQRFNPQTNPRFHRLRSSGSSGHRRSPSTLGLARTRPGFGLFVKVLYGFINGLSKTHKNSKTWVLGLVGACLIFPHHNFDIYLAVLRQACPVHVRLLLRSRGVGLPPSSGASAVTSWAWEGIALEKFFLGGGGQTQQTLNLFISSIDGP